MLKNMNPLTHSVITLSLHLISKMEYFGFRHFSDKKNIPFPTIATMEDHLKT